jgi:NADH:ubiquinone oxidoreductase subunit F (NADH-binding)
LLSFPTLPASQLVPPAGGGRSTASYGATDQNGNGVTLLGIGPAGTGAYTAEYNGFVPAGTTFANLVNMIQAGPGGSASASQTFPGGAGYAQINADVYDMSMQSAFTLTANDLANGTVTYRVLPEPTAALALLALAAVARRR